MMPVPGIQYLATPDGQILTAKGRILPQHGSRYLSVWAAGRKQSVHRLVCAAFHGLPPSPRAHARHLNGLKQDNRSDNLAWGTPRDNAMDKRRHGTHQSGTKNPRAKLSETDVRTIRARHAEHLAERQKQGFSYVRRGFLAALTKEFNLCATSYALHIVRGPVWNAI